jgi:hypothetical protein
MRILCPVISPSRRVKSQIVRDESLRQEAIFHQELSHQFQRRSLIPLGLEQDIQHSKHVTIMIRQCDETA